MSEVREEEKERSRAAGAPASETRPRKQVERAVGRTFTPAERLLILDIWEHSEIGAPQFGELLGMTSHTLYQWRRRFEKGARSAWS